MLTTIRRLLLGILLCAQTVGCRTELAPVAADATPIPPDVVSLPEEMAVSPTLTKEEIESVRARLWRREVKQIAELKSAIPGKVFFMPVSFTLMSSKDKSGRPRLYEEKLSVCRLTKDQDLIVLEDTRSQGLIKRWWFRDLRSQK